MFTLISIAEKNYEIFDEPYKKQEIEEIRARLKYAREDLTLDNDSIMKQKMQEEPNPSLVNQIQILKDNLVQSKDTDSIYLSSSQKLESLDPQDLYFPSYLKEERIEEDEEQRPKKSIQLAKKISNSKQTMNEDIILQSHFHRYRDLLLKNTDKNYHLNYETKMKFEKMQNLMATTLSRMEIQRDIRKSKLEMKEAEREIREYEMKIPMIERIHLQNQQRKQLRDNFMEDCKVKSKKADLQRKKMKDFDKSQPIKATSKKSKGEKPLEFGSKKMAT